MASLDYTSKDKTAYIRYRINGKMFRKNIGKVTKTVARKILSQFETTLALKKLGICEPKNILLADVMNEYVEWAKNNQSKNTYLSKCRSKKNIDVFLLTHVDEYKHTFQLHELTTSLIEKYKQYRCAQHLNGASINKELNFISGLIKLANEWGYVIPNVTIRRYKEIQKSPRYFSHHEIHQLQTKSSHYLRQIIMIGLNTGMRIGEILHLEWKHVNMTQHHIIVANTDSFHTKNRKDRMIPINSELQSYFNMLKNTFIHPSTDQPTPRTKHQMKYVICQPTGEPIASVKKSFRRLLKRLNIQNASIHTLRHTFASNCVMNGVDLYTVKEFLGHQRISTTEIYAHLSNEFKKKSIEKIVKIRPLPEHPHLRLVNE
tara:strand:- start:532 stop:1653 length:1122 start_codon:yes stop_codon:yes gene_type:complete